MKSVMHCRGCRAILAQEQLAQNRGSCPYCGLSLMSASDLDAEFHDPYAPPSAGLGEPSELIVPPGLGAKLLMALRLFFGQLPLFAAVVLTVWIPLNLLIEFAIAQNPNAMDPLIMMRISSLAEMVFGPICSGAIVTALANRMGGRSTGYAEAMRAGLHHWGRLLAARFVAGLIIGLGLLALIIPGLVLAVRFSLIDEVVVLEGQGSAGSRARSTQLTRGRRWSIFCGTVVAFGLMMLTAVVVSIGLEFAELSESPWASAGYSSLIDVLSVIVTCLVFVFYWEAREREIREQSVRTKPALSGTALDEWT